MRNLLLTAIAVPSPFLFPWFLVQAIRSRDETKAKYHLLLRPDAAAVTAVHDAKRTSFPPVPRKENI